MSGLMFFGRSAFLLTVLLLATAPNVLAQTVDDFPDFVPEESTIFERPLLPVEPGYEEQQRETIRPSFQIAGARVSPDFKRRGLRVEIPMETAFGTGRTLSNDAETDDAQAFGR